MKELGVRRAAYALVAVLLALELVGCSVESPILGPKDENGQKIRIEQACAMVRYAAFEGACAFLKKYPKGRERLESAAELLRNTLRDEPCANYAWDNAVEKMLDLATEYAHDEWRARIAEAYRLYRELFKPGDLCTIGQLKGLLALCDGVLEACKACGTG